MVSCDGLLWHQYIADYSLHADKELVEKISQDAKERMAVRKVLPTAQGREVKTETGEATEVLAEIAGTGIVQLNL